MIEQAPGIGMHRTLELVEIGAGEQRRQIERRAALVGRHRAGDPGQRPLDRRGLGLPDAEIDQISEHARHRIVLGSEAVVGDAVRERVRQTDLEVGEGALHDRGRHRLQQTEPLERGARRESLFLDANAGNREVDLDRCELGMAHER